MSSERAILPWLTVDVLRATMPNLPAGKAFVYLVPLKSAQEEFLVTTRLRTAAFLAQLAHESSELRQWVEGDSGEAYEGRTDLGNVVPGDGPKYKGRGPIQLTGRANYREFGALLSLPLESHPDLVLRPEVGFRVAAAFWRLHGCNHLADVSDFGAVTRAINGGLTHLPQRLAYYRRALAALGLPDPNGKDLPHV